MHATYACMHWSADTLHINVPEGYTNHHAKFEKIGSEMSENLAFKGKMVRFGLDWFGLV